MDVLPLGEQLAEVAVVDIGVGGPAQDEDPLPDLRIQPARGNPPPVAVDESTRTLALKARPEPPQLPFRDRHTPRRLGHRQPAGEDHGQNPSSFLLFVGHGDRRLHLGRLTESLCS